MDGGVFASMIAAAGGGILGPSTREPAPQAECPSRYEGGPHRFEPGAPGSPDWCYYCETERPARQYFGKEIAERPAVAPEGVGRPVDHGALDALESAILDRLPAVHMPVIHRFVPGMYIREIFMPAGTVLTSRQHETEHPYMVLSGVALVTIPGQEPVRLEAGHVGITRAGTRRALFIEEDCRWLTCHVLSAEEEAARAAGRAESEILAMIEARIIGKRERADGRDIFREYQERLASGGLPGPHDGARALEKGNG